MMGDARAFRPTRTAAFRKIGEKIVIVHTLENRLLTLNETGGFLWERLGSGGIEELAAALAAEFDVDEERARADAREFIDEMVGRGLVEEVP
jgi:hypothetical protein